MTTLLQIHIWLSVCMWQWLIPSNSLQGLAYQSHCQSDQCYKQWRCSSFSSYDQLKDILITNGCHKDISRANYIF
jgi:hypothetical protein